METVIVIAIVGAAVGYVVYTYVRSAKKHLSKTESNGCDGDCAGCSLQHKDNCDDITPE